MIVNVAGNWNSVENFYKHKMLIKIKGAIKNPPNELPVAVLVLIRKNVDTIAIGKPAALWDIAKKYEAITHRIVSEDVVRFLVEFCSDVAELIGSIYSGGHLQVKYSVLTNNEDKEIFLREEIGKIVSPSKEYLADANDKGKISNRTASLVLGKVNSRASVSDIRNFLLDGLRGYVFDIFISNLNRVVLGMFLKHYKNAFYDIAYELCDRLNIPVCPYCNISFTSHVENDLGKFRPEFDHFYPKAHYPILTLSLYNLIPSCRECNDIKGDKVFFKEPHLHPLHNAGVSFYVKQPWRAMWFRRGSKHLSTGLEVCISSCPEKGSLDALLLPDRYSRLKSEVIEILGSMYYFRESMVGSLYNNRLHWRRVVMRGVDGHNYKRRIMGRMILDLAKIARI